MPLTDADASMALPKNGVLSGMAITYVTAILAIVTGLGAAPAHLVFMGTPSPSLLDGMLASIAVMGVHKAECYWTREYEVCPVYITAARGRDNRQTLFVGFVLTFLGMLA